MINRFTAYLYQPVDAANLGLFRILFGLVLFAQTAWFLWTDFVKENLVKPIVHFKYHFFQFLEPFSEGGLNLLMWGMLAASVLIALGLFFRAAMAYFLVAFTYLWLLDKGYFNNHYYLISLLSGLFLFTNADRWGALRKKAESPSTVPQWQLFILKAQWVIVFFVAGLNKLNPYWLFDFQPMQYILEAKANVSDLEVLRSATLAALMSYGGLFLDLLVGFALWWRKTRVLAIIALFLFNVTNFWIFYNIGEIGIFPFMVLASIVLFIDPVKINAFFNRFKKEEKNKRQKRQRKIPILTPKPMTTYLIMGYLAFQFLFPFRHFLYAGPVDWSGEGQRFAWRMKIMLKEATPMFYLVDQNGQDYEVNPASMLTPKQYTALIYYPDVLPDVARKIKERGMEKGLLNPKVKVEMNVKFMGRGEPKPIVDPNVDLTKLYWKPFGKTEWVLEY